MSSRRRAEKERVSAKYASNTSKIRRAAGILKHVPEKRPFGKVISDRRIEFGMTQAALAYEIEVQESMVAKIEDGSRFPDIKYLPAFAKALRIDLVTLWMTFIRQRCPEVHRAVIVRIGEEPEIVWKLDALPRPLRKTVMDMVNALYQEETSQEKSA